MKDNTKELVSYTRGDVREDRMIFWKKRSDRLSGARWLTPEKFAEYIEKDRLSRERRYPNRKPRPAKPTRHEVYLRRALSGAKKRAKEKGWDFDLDFQFLVDAFPKDGLCPLSGAPMVWGNESGIDCSPSVDRMEPAKGYTKDNVWWISHKENNKKRRYERVLPPWVKVYAGGEGRTEFDWRIDRPAASPRMEP